MAWAPLQAGTTTFAGLGGLQADPSVFATPGTLTVESANGLNATSDQWTFGFVFSAEPTAASQCRAWLVLRYAVN